MGYDMTLFKLKKKTVNSFSEKIPSYTLSELYNNILFCYLYPEEYDIPEDEVGEIVECSNKNLLRNCLGETVANGEVVEISKETLESIKKYYYDLLSTKTLIEISVNDIDYWQEMIVFYNGIKNLEIKDDEMMFFEHNW